MKNEKIEQVNAEFSRLSKGFKALNVDHKKRVLKTARGLLSIQRVCKEMVTDSGHPTFSGWYK
jgi:hypothetical protein